jgi:hypothetical protein
LEEGYGDIAGDGLVGQHDGVPDADDIPVVVLGLEDVRLVGAGNGEPLLDTL